MPTIDLGKVVGSVSGEMCELIPFIEDATYSSGATVQTLVPFDASAIYLGDFGGMGCATMTATLLGNGTYLMRVGGFLIPTVSGTQTYVFTAALSFASDGVTSGTLSYINRYTLNGTSVKQDTPTSAVLGPMWMLRKIEQGD